MNDIQKQRVKRYFIEAAREILEDQGPEALSARHVAKRAGYSYATIYNHFDDFNHLLWYVNLEYRDQLVDFLKDAYQRMKLLYQGSELIQEMFIAYTQFFLARPSIYIFIFSRQIGIMPADIKQNSSDSSLADMLVSHLAANKDNSSLTAEQISILANVLISMVHGLLSLYFSGKDPMDDNGLQKQIRANIQFIFRSIE